MLLQLGGLNLLTDPVFGKRASPVRWAGPRRVMEPGLSLVQIAKRTQADVKRMAATVNHVQTPAYYDQIVGDVVLNDPPDKAASAAKSAAVQVALPSAVEKLPLQPRDTVVAPGNEALAELDALAKAENWHELGDHLTDIKPTARDLHWNGLVEQAAIGELTPLASPSGGSVAERLAMIKRYYPTFPSLRSSPQFMALRASIGKAVMHMDAPRKSIASEREVALGKSAV